MRKYLKTVDFKNTKNIMFKITPFLPPRILPTKLYDLENPLMTLEKLLYEP